MVSEWGLKLHISNQNCPLSCYWMSYRYQIKQLLPRCRMAKYTKMSILIETSWKTFVQRQNCNRLEITWIQISSWILLFYRWHMKVQNITGAGGAKINLNCEVKYINIFLIMVENKTESLGIVWNWQSISYLYDHQYVYISAIYEYITVNP